MNKNYIKIFVSINDLGKRIDKILSEKIDGFSRNKIQTLITNGNITLENLIIKDQSFLIKKEGGANNGEFDDPDADELFEDEWVVIKLERTERPDLVALNTKERIQRATIEMTSSEAQ